ncbi:putative Hemerythrin HHE cation binding region [Candidatus Terasakiella magnetica]|uniref:Putative Hemerythrin HHE cation binding region n=1 Tax=Candidatus Terasakiella magnetica TaxID=1867952 RepID=A0A1C3RGR3_9PROT|nr:hemerythrin family protein [Candidatus Terasakiella magnetica]SCA56404.1 putative Hemerythrin HHE cation binding region [Candidatus Terasakiella magnetica]
MQIKEWPTEFELGIAPIDDDHRMLFRTIQQLGRNIEDQRDSNIIAATIASLILYVDEHFEREERFLLRAGYPDFDAHKQIHDEFRDAILSLRDFHQTYPDDVDADKIVSFLEVWLLDHIAKVDKAYEPYLTGEKQGDPKIRQRMKYEEKTTKTVQLSCPADKEDYVKHFISLISEGSREGILIEVAVESVTIKQLARRESKAKKLFGR